MSEGSKNYSLEIEQLRTIIFEQNQSFQAQKDELQRRYEQIEEENKILREQVKLLSLKIYGKSSEKYYGEDLPSQPSLWEDPAIEEERESIDEDKVLIPEHERQKRGRPPLPPDLPRKEIIHDILEEEKIDSLGRQMVVIGKKKSSEKLCITPAKIWIEEHYRLQYGSVVNGIDDEESEIKIAPVPVQLLPKSFGSPSLVSHILTAKFADSLPFYRQEKQFSRLGIDLSRSTMCNWTLKLWDRCRILKEILFEEMRSGCKIHIDETRTYVICEENKEASSQSFMWVARGGPPDRPVIFFHYSPNKSRDNAYELLDGFVGIVQTDGNPVYDYLDFLEGVIHAGCWAHSRRYFRKVIDLLGPNKKEGIASKMIGLIKKLYAIERKAKAQSLSPEDRLLLRQKESKPVVIEIKELLDEIYPHVAPKSYLGKAVGYMQNQWHRLIVFLDNGLINLDNNRIENDLRPFCVGRKNWLFNYHAEGAKASAFFYSLIETAKANNYEPQSYLNYFFKNLPYAKTKKDYKLLLPQYIDPACVKSLMNKK